ncbi:MAG: ABC transporter permease [Thaumarchaeota archaeon]|nr:ABC transporter permease [Nitrososphaerota archaeon]
MADNALSDKSREVTQATSPALDLEFQNRKNYEIKEKPTTQRKHKSRRSEISFPIKVVIFLGSLVLFILVWQIASDLAGNSVILAGPVPVLQALVALFQVGSATGNLGTQNVFGALLETFEVVGLGFGLSIVVGIPIGVLMGRWKTAEDIGDPWVSLANSIPIVTVIPALYFSIGGGFSADVFISFFISVFTVIFNTFTGVRYVSNALAEIGKTFGASEIQFITKIVIPASLPNIFAGMRIAVGRALLGAVMAEAILGGNHGLGGLMTTFQDILYTPPMMATVILIALIGIVFLQAPKILERHAFKWKESESRIREIPR